MSARRRRRSPRVGRGVVALGSCAGGLVLAAAFLSVTVQANALGREKAALRADIASALGEQASLQHRIETQKTDDYVTAFARRYGWIGPNESLFAIPQDGQPSGQTATRVGEPARVVKWVRFFFGSR